MVMTYLQDDMNFNVICRMFLLKKKHIFAMHIMICMLLAGGCRSQSTCLSLRDGDNDTSLQSGNASNVVGMLCV